MIYEGRGGRDSEICSKFESFFVSWACMKSVWSLAERIFQKDDSDSAFDQLVIVLIFLEKICTTSNGRKIAGFYIFLLLCWQQELKRNLSVLKITQIYVGFNFLFVSV